MKAWFADWLNRDTVTPPVLPWISYRPSGPLGHKSCPETYGMFDDGALPQHKVPIGMRDDVKWHGKKTERS